MVLVSCSAKLGGLQTQSLHWLPLHRQPIAAGPKEKGVESLQIAINAVVPFLVYMGFGLIVRKAGWAPVEFLHTLNGLAFKGFFPLMMFYCMYQLEDETLIINPAFIGFAVAALAVVIVALLIIVPRIEPTNARRGVIIQGIYRTNLVFFLLPLAQNVFGNAALVPASMMVAFIMPTYNVLAVIILEYYRGGKPSPKKLALSVLKNPLIVGFLVGCLFYALHIKLPGMIEAPVIAMANLSIPLALIVLGGTISISETRENAKTLAGVVSTKLVILPAIALAISLLVPLSPIERFLVVMMFAAPTAASSFPMAAAMGGDGQLAGQIVALTSVISVLTLFCWVLVFSFAGLL